MRKRREFSKATQRLAYQRCCDGNGVPRCESILVPSIADLGCNRVLRQGDFHYHHIFAAALGGSNDLENVAVLCKTCHAITSAVNEAKVIAQDRRVCDLARGIKDPWRRRLPGARDSEIRMKIGGGVVDRRTGLPWRGSQ